MRLEQAIHQRWATSGGLVALLPAQRVKTGRAFGDATPYATVEHVQGQTAFRTNAGDALDEVTVRINVWHDNYDEACAIAEQVKLAFDRSAFPLAGGDKVVQMRRVADSASQDGEGLWRLAIDFVTQVHLPSGA